MSAGPSRIIPGEYDHVARASRDADALRRAHATPLDRAGAERMVRDLAARYLSETDAAALVVRFGSRYGRAGGILRRQRVPRMRADGTPVLHWRTGKPRYRMVRVGPAVPYITLPSEPMTTGGDWWGVRTTRTGRARSGSRLRVGLVLHEFAHVLTWVRTRRSDYHGPAFVAQLDALVAEWAAKNPLDASLQVG